MTLDEVEAARSFIAAHTKMPIDSPELVGYELVSADMNPDNPSDIVALHHMVEDHNGSRGRAVEYRLAEAADGTLTLWSLPPESLPL